MIREGKIGFAEGFALLYISSISSVFLTLPSKLIEDGKNMAWFLFVNSIIYVLISFFIVTLLMKRHRNVTLIEASEEILGPYLGMMINLIFALYFITRESFLFRTYSEALLVSALTRTPISVVLITIALAALISAYYGFETIARVARVSLAFVVGGIVLLVIAVIKDIEIVHLYPLWSMDPFKLMAKAATDYTVTSEVLIPAIIFHTFGGWKHFRKAGMLALLAGGLTILLVTNFVLLISGVEVASEMLSPFYSLSEAVSIGRFFKRIEAVFLLTWAMVGFLKAGFFLYISTVIIARMLRLPDYRPLIWIIALLCFALSILPPDLPTAYVLERNLLGLWGLLPTVFIPLFLLIVSMIRKTGEGQNDSSEAN